MNRRFLLRLVAPLAVMGVIFFFSAQPAAAHHAWWVFLIRKIGHVFGYALLTTAWWWALRGVVRRPLVWAIGISLAYACTDEYHQTFVRGRTGTPRDVGIDAIGIALAALLVHTRRLPLLRGGPRRENGPSRSSLARSP